MLPLQAPILAKSWLRLFWIPLGRKTASFERVDPSGTQENLPRVSEAEFSPDIRGSAQVAIQERIKVTVTFLHAIAKDWSLSKFDST